MRIVIISWVEPNLLTGTGYTHSQAIEGTEDDALRIAGELFKSGLQVMLKPNFKDSYILLAVDNRGFGMR
jgi:hypothetical protein